MWVKLNPMKRTVNTPKIERKYKKDLLKTSILCFKYRRMDGEAIGFFALENLYKLMTIET